MPRGRPLKALAPSYRKVRSIPVHLGGVAIALATRPGFPDWSRVTPPMELLVDLADIHVGDSVLVCPCGHGAVGAWAARQTAPERVYLRDTNAIATAVARNTMALAGHGRSSIATGTLAAQDGALDVVLMIAPKGRDLAKLYLLNAYLGLRAGGRLYLSGSNRGGIKSVLNDATFLFGPGLLLGYRRGCRVARFSRPPRSGTELPAPFREPGLANGTFAELSVCLGGDCLTILSRPGVFSWRHPDPGTLFLLDALSVRRDDSVLDVGCGYGLIGMHSSRQATDGFVALVDVDTLACECAQATLDRNGFAGKVVLGDGLEAVRGERFSLVASNPPFHSGHSVSTDAAEAFIRESHAALVRRGRLAIVANRFLPYDRLIEDVFGQVETLASNKSYHVLSATKRRSGAGARKRHTTVATRGRGHPRRRVR